MKKLKYTIRTMSIIGAMTLLSSCQDDFLKDVGLGSGDGVTFVISAPVEEEAWVTRSLDGEVETESLTTLRYLVADAAGNVLTHHYSRLSADLGRLTVDGLRPGEYSIVFLGASQESDLAEITDPARLDDGWLSNTVSSLPLEGSYFYKKLDFTVDPSPSEMTIPVKLERPMAKVKVEIPGLTAALEDLISSIKISVDNTDIYSVLNADGSYSGEAEFKDYELVDSLFNLELNTLPSATPISGTIKVRAATMPGDSLFTTYRFENLKMEAGKVTTVSLKLQHPDSESGFVLIRPRDYYDYNADLMMMADEPLSVLHDSRHRRYNVLYPLVVSTWEDQMRVRLFTAGPVDDVDIYADFPSLGLDSVKVARMERVEPMLDMLVPMPFLERECKYYDVRGKRVTIPKMSALPADIKFYFETPDEYLAQLKALKFDRWAAWCPSYETYWARYARTPTCDLIRHAFVINQCMAIMYDSEEFYTILAAHEGEYVNNGVNLTNEDIINRVYNMAGFGWGSCNPASGAIGWGGGSTMIFMAAFFRNGMYPGTNLATPLTSARETLFHEFGHCLGFSHNGNMTYGRRWTLDCSNAYLNCYKNGKMKYGLPIYINSIPYEREDAPKWAKPRFVQPTVVEPEDPEDPGEIENPEGPGSESENLTGPVA